MQAAATTRSFFYSLYGLVLESNLPLPGLSSVKNLAPDLQIVLGQPLPAFIKEDKPWYVSPIVETGSPVVTVWKGNDGSAYYFVYYDGTEFIIDSDGAKVSAAWPSQHSLENTCYYLVGQIAAFVLRLRGIVSIHGSTILIKDRALTISGDSGSGKSTTAAAFARKGFSVLSEDVSALIERDNQLCVQIGYPRINLWPDTVGTIYGPQHELPKIMPNWEKLYLDLAQDDRFHKSEATLGAIYILETRRSSDDAPCIEQMSASDSLVQLLTNAHGRHLVDQKMREREFAIATRIVSEVPVRKVVPHSDLSKVDAMVDLILSDFRNVTS